MFRLGRKNDEMRDVKIEPSFLQNAEGSCLVSYGNTKVICSASYDSRAPYFLRGQNRGWITAEYSMLPRSTHTRTAREAKIGKQSGRTSEIQRLISRSLRASIDLELLPECQIIIDCDVMQADGGTRTAAITGGYVALYQALRSMQRQGIIDRIPIKHQVAAVSCGIVGDKILLDLDYKEDSNAAVDANFVLSTDGKIIEIQATGETRVYTKKEMDNMLEMAIAGSENIFEIQNQVL